MPVKKEQVTGGRRHVIKERLKQGLIPGEIAVSAANHTVRGMASSEDVCVGHNVKRLCVAFSSTEMK